MALVGGPALGSNQAHNVEKKSPRVGGKRLFDYLTARNLRFHHNTDIVNLTRNHPNFLYRMNLMKKLPVHNGCVNTVCWNKTGEYLLSGSDDCNLCITKPSYLFDESKDYTVLHKIPTCHYGNIFSARFMPNSCDSILASCSSEGPVIVHDINSTDPSQGIFTYSCHTSAIYEVATLPDEDKVFLTCGDDKTVRLFDLRCHRSCKRPTTCPHPALIRNSLAMTTLSVHPLNSSLIMVGRADGLGLVYDRRKLPNPSEFSREQAHINHLANAESGRNESTFKYLHPMEGAVSQFCVPDIGEKDRLTSLCYSSNGQQVLASFFHDYIYLFDHDKSSNFKLIQTLPRNSAETSDEGNGNSEIDSDQVGRNIPRTSRRFRLRNDWSDTGVNSVPYSARSTNSSSQTSNLLQRMTEIVCNRRVSGRTLPFQALFVPATDLVGPVDVTTPSGGSSSTPNEDDMEDEEEEENEGVSNPSAQLNFVECPDECEDSKADSTNQVDEQPTVSQEAKLKFKKITENLKDRYYKIPTWHPRVRYQGHRNCKTIIKEAIFWGGDYIMSGSDCGRIMIWEKETAKLVMAFPADERVVNCLAPNPHYYALASCGIDYDIKLWSTQSALDCPLKISEKDMDAIVRNNELMLEEAKQTTTVPLHLLFRFLASYAQNQ